MMVAHTMGEYHFNSRKAEGDFSHGIALSELDRAVSIRRRMPALSDQQAQAAVRYPTF
jgi:hypothetical protein